MKKTISFLLCLVMVLGMVPATLAAGDAATGPQLYSSSAEWSSRINVSGYSDFRHSLQAHLTDELMNPSEDSLLENGNHGILIRKFTGTPAFTYDANAADPAAVAEEAAAAAIDAAIAEAGNHDLATVTAYATAIYTATLQDYPRVFWLGSDILVDEVLTYELEYEAGEGTATYTQSFYFYITTADGSFDIRIEDYRDYDETAVLFQSLQFSAIDLTRSEALNNRTYYEVLQNLNQWLTENNTHHTGSDISHASRNAISALTDVADPVSEGYARAFKLICDLKGIPCTLVVGFANGEPHTWNYVQMPDKNWYAVDVALNDLGSDTEKAKYFLVGSDTVIDGVAFEDSHIVTNQLTEGGVAFTNGPALCENAYTVLPEDISYTAVYVNGKDVREIDDDTITWDEETNTLTLNNASILAENGTYKGSGIYAVGTDTLVLELVGENTVEGKFGGKDVDDLFANAAISTVSSLVIRGDGTLTATDLETGTDDTNTMPHKSAGIYAGGNLTIESGTIHATGRSAQGNYERSAGIIAGDYDSLATLTISGGTVNATGLTRGITAFDTIRITGGTVNAANSDSTYEYGMGLEVKSLENSDLNTGIHISGGTVTAQGTKYAAYMFLNCSGYENPMWTDTEGGAMIHTGVPSTAGMYSTYLHIEQAAYQLVQPTADNHYTVDVETLVGGEYTAALPEGVTAEYKWYQQHSQAVTAQDVTPPYDGNTLVCTYDEATGLWTFPSAYESNAGYMAFAAEPGETVMLDLLPNEAGMLIIMSGGESMFTASADGVYTHTVTEADMNPETGLFMMVVVADAQLQGTLSIESVEEVATAAELPNRFSSAAAGTYFGRVTLTKDGTAVAELQSKAFAYEPVNTVTFDANGGTCDTETAKTQEGLHTLGALPQPTRTGYTFTGWFDAKEGGSQITADTVIMEDVTVYAQWTINSYTLTVQGLSGTVYEEQVTYGSDLAEILTGLNLGDITTEKGVYTFEGFDLSCATMPAEALTVTAVYSYTGWMEESDGTTYLVDNEKIYVNQWQEIDGVTYYFDASSYIVKDITEIDGTLYAFDHETGAFLADYTGTYEALNGDVYYVQNGLAFAIFVGGVGMNEGEYLSNAGVISTTEPDGGYAHYADGYLILDNYVYEGTGGTCAAAIYSPSHIRILLRGINSLTNTLKGGNGINTAGVSLMSSGTLTVTSDGNGIHADGDVSITDCTVTVSSANGIGINVYRDDELPGRSMVISSATLNITNGVNGIQVGNANVYGYAAMTITDSTVTVKVNNDGIRVLGDLLIENNSVISVTTTDVNSPECGILADNVTVTDSTVDYEGSAQSGIVAYCFMGGQGITFTNSTITIRGGALSICSYKYITITGGHVAVTDSVIHPISAFYGITLNNVSIIKPVDGTIAEYEGSYVILDADGNPYLPTATIGTPCEHANAADDNDCTTAVICPDCDTEITPAKAHADEDNSGRCDHCGILLQSAKLRFASISLKGNIAINYYMLLSDEVLADATAYMQFTMADGEVIQIPVSEGVKYEYEGETYYVFTCAVDAKEMTDDVVSQFFYDGGSTDPYTYSVKTYADHILANSTNEKMKNLVKAMLHYGAATQTHFGYNTDALANADLEATDYAGVAISGFNAVAGQGTAQAQFYSATLILKSETTLRFFFTGPITATYNGQALQVKQRGSLYYVDVVGISAKNLDENVTITVSDGTNTADVSFNPMSYCQSVLNDTTGTFDQEMKDLVSALYLYNQAANAYFTEN